MKRAWVWLVLAACAAPWPRPTRSNEWQAAFRACRGGNQQACYWRAASLRAQDFDGAVKLYERSCEGGAGQSCNELGFFAKQGRGVPESGAKAMEYWKRACALGSKDGCDSLGTGWRDGVGGEVNHAEAVKAYQTACALKDEYGCSNLALALMLGEGVPKDAARAEALWRAGCANDENVSDACRHLGTRLVRGDGVTRDVEGGLAMLRRGCRLGGAADCYAASVAMQAFGDSIEARRYLRTSCAWGSAKGCFTLSQALMAGDAGVEELAEAKAVKQKACADGLDEACEAGAPASP